MLAVIVVTATLPITRVDLDDVLPANTRRGVAFPLLILLGPPERGRNRSRVRSMHRLDQRVQARGRNYLAAAE